MIARKGLRGWLGRLLGGDATSGVATLAALAAVYLCAAGLVATFLTVAGLSGISWCHPLTFSAHVLPEAALLTLPGVLVWPRWRYLGPTLLGVAGLLLWANILYLRNFDDMLSLSMLRLGTTIDAIVVRSAMASARPVDWLFALWPAMGAAAVALLSPKAAESRLPRRAKLAATLLTVVALIAGEAKLFRDFKKHNISVGTLSASWSLATKLQSFYETISYTHHCTSVAYILDAYNTYLLYSSNQEMPKESIRSIVQWRHGEVLQDGLNTEHPNLMLIVVESLNTRAVEWSYNGRTAMPFLNSLIADTTTIAFTAVCPQVGKGRSSDGQLMYYTGIYPSQANPMCDIDPNGPYPSMSRLLATRNFSSSEMIAEKPNLWNHDKTNRAFGFDTLDHSLIDSVKLGDIDSVLFAKAQARLSATIGPFMLTATTLSMHDPYNKPTVNATWISQVASIDSRDAIYLEACAAFDKTLSRFMQWLRQSNKWKNTVVAIVSDHAAREMCLSPAMSDGRVLFVLLNSGLPGRRCDDVVGQIDVYPTLIDAMGLWDSARWRGFGSSLLRATPGFAVRLDGTVVGDTAGRAAAIDRQRRALELSQQWIRANNKADILDALSSPQ